jgi:hypothetical protein
VVTEVARATARLLRQRLAERPLWLPVEGGSMRPTITPPAEVQVAARDRPRLGEIWAFVGPDGSIVVHRYERRSADRFVFHGDAFARSDPAVTADVLVGRAVALRDHRGPRPLGRADRWRGLARLAWRRAGAVVRTGARWAFLLISRGTRSG